MSDPKNEEFLDDIENAAAEESADESIDITAEEIELDELRAERDALQDKFMRALADAENARKRADKDRREAENYGGSKLARDLLPVYDNLKRALEAISDEQRDASAAFIEGIELTQRELVNVFAKHGIKLISPAVGDRFDPQHHEAMFEAPVPGTKAGDIIQVSAEGFMLQQCWVTHGSADKYWNIRCIKNKHGWRYFGRVHEWISKTNTTTGEKIDCKVGRGPEECLVFQDRNADMEKSLPRFQRDKVLLLEDHYEQPEEPRTMFYLAQTLGSTNDPEDAYYFYKLRTPNRYDLCTVF